MFLPTKNKGYVWNNYNDTYFKGYFIINSNLYKSLSATEYIASFKSEDNLRSFLEKAEGSFAFYTKIDGVEYAAVDVARSIPIYFLKNGDYISDSSEEIRKKIRLPKGGINYNTVLEMHISVSNYIIGNRTAYNDISQLDCGQYLVMQNNQYSVKNYYFHKSEINNLNKDDALGLLKESYKKAFEQIVIAIDNRPVLLSLSGGYDSRCVACMLKSVGVENVLCYTYGKKDSFEVRQSQSVADALGYKWICIEYDDVASASMLDDGFFEYCNEHDYLVYTQNFPAVKYLYEHNLIPDNVVAITGLCGDMPSGNYVVEKQVYGDVEFTNKLIAETLFKSRFSRFKLKSEAKEVLMQNVLDVVNTQRNGQEIENYQDFVSICDAANTCMSHSRAFLHMNRVHEYFGMEWLLPCWNKNILNAWYSLPYCFRIRQNLYEDWIVALGEEYGTGGRKYRATYSRNKFVNRLKHKVGACLVFLYWKIGLPFRRKYDYNNYSVAEYLLYKRLKNKIKFKYSYAGFGYLLSRYLIENRYGEDNVINIVKNIY